MDSGSDGDRAEPGDASSKGVGGEGVEDERVEMPPYFSRVNCAKILMELQLHDVCSHTHAHTHTHTHTRGGSRGGHRGPPRQASHDIMPAHCVHPSQSWLLSLPRQTHVQQAAMPFRVTVQMKRTHAPRTMHIPGSNHPETRRASLFHVHFLGIVYGYEALWQS